jgi:hypothetical protein
MRNVLAIMIALMFVVLVLSPTMGYSVQIGNHSYSLKATRVRNRIIWHVLTDGLRSGGATKLRYFRR